ncbi:MAG: hypothetical protein CSA66_01010 [Proteobacteria bacterium]|nr:MAG: hypothetical protein CSA66_01010 [Pseudomonadota bacterium]
MNTPRMIPMRIDTTSHATTAPQTPMTTQRMRLGRVVCRGSGAAGMCRPSYRSWYSRSRRPGASLALALAVAIAVAAAASRPAVAEPVRLDVHRGPLVASSRITGLGGAFTGVAEGIDGALKNPASLANRPARSVTWFDYDLTLDWLLTTGANLDYDADGLAIGEETSFSAVNLGVDLQLGPLAVGVLGATVSYESEHGTAVIAGLSDVLIGVAWAFDDGSLIAGLGLNLRVFDLREPAVGAYGRFVGPSWDLGLLWRPRALPWRVGAQVRLGARVVESADEGDATALSQGRQVSAIIAPYQIAIGVSHWRAADPQRRYNARLRSGSDVPSDRRRADLRYLLLSADLVYTGPSRDAYNIEGFLHGSPIRAGERGVLSVHVGAEGEVLSNLLRARVGSYLEPSRVKGTSLGRLHLTGGVEVRLFRLWKWQIKATFAFDAAARWKNLTLGFGVWN